MKNICILGGGTNTYISSNIALSAPDYGSTAIKLESKFMSHPENKMNVHLYLTKMAHPDCEDAPDTPEQVEALVDSLISDPNTKVIIFNVTVIDFKPTYLTEWRQADKSLGLDTSTFGKYTNWITTKGTPVIDLELKPYHKIINKIRKERKDILLVGFKTTCGSTKEEQFREGLKLCKDASADVVFIDDVDKDRINKLQECIDYFNINKTLFSLLKEKIDTRTATEGEQQVYVHYSQQYNNWLNRLSKLQNNGLVTPEESSYWYDTKDEALDGLVQMVLDHCIVVNSEIVL